MKNRFFHSGLSTLKCSLWLLIAILSAPVLAQDKLAAKVKTRDNGCEEMLTRAGVEIRAEKYNQVLPLLNSIISRCPQDHRGYAFRAVVLGHAGHCAEAMADADRANLLDPNHSACLKAKLDCLVCLGRYQESLALANQYARKNPNASWIYSNRGYSLCGLGKYKAAVPDLTVFLEAHPTDFQGLTARSLAEAAAGDYALSIGDIEQLSKLARQSFRLNLSPEERLFGNVRLYHALLEDFDRRVKNGNNTAQNQYTRALCYYSMQRFTDCVNASSEAIKKDKLMLQPYILRAYANTALKQIAAARADIDRAITMAPNAESGYTALANVNFLNGTYIETVDELTKLLRQNPDNSALLLTRARVLTELGREQEALTDLNHVTKISPQKAEPFLARAEINQSKGAWYAAVADFSRAISLQKTFVAASYKGRAGCYVELHDYQKAIDDLNKLIANYHSDKPYLARAICFEKLGQKERAEADRATAFSFQSTAKSRNAGQ